jgi:phosphoribosyl 1,2-cyclic phosphodiesterase
MSDPVFTLTYWGVTGTLTSPLLPCEVQDKLIDSLCLLIANRRLENLSGSPDLRAAVTEIVRTEVPFHLRSTYGGNTTCIEVRTPDELLIFDCGSGFRELGYSLLERWRQAGPAARHSAHILISHAHMDHTYGTPFFLPYYQEDCSFDLYALQLVIDSLTAVLSPESALSRLYFPPTYSEMKAPISYHPLTAGSEFRLGSTRVRTYDLSHPGESLAFRIENAGRAIVIATDHEHPESPDPGLAQFARGADLLYIDGQYLYTEYEGAHGIGQDPPLSRIGWGHSPMEACVKTAVEAGAAILHVGHRDPRRGDAELAEVEKYLQDLTTEELKRTNRAPDSCRAAVPYEGMQIAI